MVFLPFSCGFWVCPVCGGSYKVNAKLDGLTGQDVTLAVTVANWDALATQDVNLGQ